METTQDLINRLRQHLQDAAQVAGELNERTHQVRESAPLFQILAKTRESLELLASIATAATWLDVLASPPKQRRKGRET